MFRCVLRAAVAGVVASLAAVGRIYSVAYPLPERHGWPPPGHPERMCPATAPTDVERALFAQVDAALSPGAPEVPQ